MIPEGGAAGMPGGGTRCRSSTLASSPCLRPLPPRPERALCPRLPPPWPPTVGSKTRPTLRRGSTSPASSAAATRPHRPRRPDSRSASASSSHHPHRRTRRRQPPPSVWGARLASPLRRAAMAGRAAAGRIGEREQATVARAVAANGEPSGATAAAHLVATRAGVRQVALHRPGWRPAAACPRRSPSTSPHRKGTRTTAALLCASHKTTRRPRLRRRRGRPPRVPTCSQTCSPSDENAPLA
mmetsp:Transcript_32228/g.104083  ORF Transcript_32228/g.104083 Transcript_32228/m.104083 type:complete len:241 (-) Transcript_32228:130-852(-)